MNDNNRRRWEMLVRASQFGIDNAVDFPALTVGGVRFTSVTAKANVAEAKSAQQQASFGSSAQEIEVKDTIRENLREQMSAISRTARGMQYEHDGIEDLFRFQRNLTDEALLAKGRAFHSESAAYNADFIAYGLNANFRLALDEEANAFEASFAAAATAKAEQVAATADIAATIREGMIDVRVLDPVVRNKYADNPGKLAAWLSASHVQAAPSPADPPPPPPPPPDPDPEP